LRPPGRGEDTAKKAYQDALQKQQLTTTTLRQLLEKQQVHIKESHDKVKAFRDSKAV
jgi:uncharacterized protein (TIGR02284 family)